MAHLVIALLGAAILFWAWRARERYKAFVWRTEDICASIERDEQHSNIGQYLSLKQDLASDEQGWLDMKINIPETWSVTDVSVGDGLVKLATEASGSFSLSRHNVGKLSFEVLSGGDNKADDELHRIWVKHAAS